jgi:hypothetical protein
MSKEIRRAHLELELAIQKPAAIVVKIFGLHKDA